MSKTKNLKIIEKNLLEWKKSLESQNELVNFEISSEEGDMIEQENFIALSIKQNVMRKNLLNKITIALNKIQNGTYGLCEATGEVIEEERLLANPIAQYSIEAQEIMERRKH